MDSDEGVPEIGLSELRSVLDGRTAATRDLVRQRVYELSVIAGDPFELSRSEYRERVLTAVRQVAREGLMASGFPEQTRAQPGPPDVAASVAAFETLAFGDLSVLIKSGVQFGLFAGAIMHLGTERHHERYLADAVSGELLGCFAMTETAHGSNVQQIATTATYDRDDDGFIVHTSTPSARKDYIGNAARHGELAVVFAQLQVDGEAHGVHAFVVPIRRDGVSAPGVTITDCGPKLGLNGVDNGRISFDRVRIPRAAMLDRFASVSPTEGYTSPIESMDRRFFTMVGTLVQGRVSVSGAGLSASKRALALAIRYGNVRRQFSTDNGGQEQLLLDYGMHQRRLMPLVARTYALNAAQQVLIDRLAERTGPNAPTDDRGQRELESRAAGTKALATWHATETIQQCREACGGAGYLAANAFASLKADTDVFTTFEGDNHVLLQLVTKGLLTDYRSEFSDLDQLGMVRFVGGQAVSTVLERSRAYQLIERVRDLMSSGESLEQRTGVNETDYHLTMFRFREAHRLQTLVRRVKGRVDAGEEPGAVLSRIQPHVILTARAHVERLILEAMVDQRKALSGDVASVYGMLADLHALASIEADRGWFMEHGRLTGSRSKAITREVTSLCRRLRPLAGELVDAFGIPEPLLDVEMLAPVAAPVRAREPQPEPEPAAAGYDVT